MISNGFAWPLEEYPSIYKFIKIVSSPLFRFLIVDFNFLINYTVKQIAGGRLSEAERRAYRGPFLVRENRHHPHDLFKSLTRSRDYLVDLHVRMVALPEMPALLLFADNDSTYKAGWLSRYEQMFPRHRSVIVKGSDHFPQEHAPSQMVAAIQDWWEPEIEQ